MNTLIYDSVKIIFLLFVMILIVGFIRTYIPLSKIKNWLEARKFGSANITASLFGAITPFCSCSSIPIFLSFIKAGIPLSVAFSFLVTSPLVNEYLVVLMFGFFGWKITVLYVIAGVLIGSFSGIILGKLKLEKYLIRDLVVCSNVGSEIKFDGIDKRLKYGFREALSVVKKLWFWIFIGIGVGVFINNFVSQEAVQQIIVKGGIFTVPLAVLLGVPLYSSCAAIVPIALALFNKGISLGTALAFMMSVSALSLPSAIILKRAMRLKLILIFFFIVMISIIIIGYLFNLLQGILI